MSDPLATGGAQNLLRLGVCLEMRERAHLGCRTGPHPLPTAHSGYTLWAVGWGCGRARKSYSNVVAWRSTMSHSLVLTLPFRLAIGNAP